MTSVEMRRLCEILKHDLFISESDLRFMEFIEWIKEQDYKVQAAVFLALNLRHA